LLVEPLPKSQDQAVRFSLPVTLSSVKRTVRGAAPVVTLDANSAAGNWRTVMWFARVRVLLPAAEVTVSLTV